MRGWLPVFHGCQNAVATVAHTSHSKLGLGSHSPAPWPSTCFFRRCGCGRRQHVKATIHTHSLPACSVCPRHGFPGGADVDATNAKGENVLHKLVQSWKDSKMLVGATGFVAFFIQWKAIIGSVRSEWKDSKMLVGCCRGMNAILCSIGEQLSFGMFIPSLEGQQDAGGLLH